MKKSLSILLSVVMVLTTFLPFVCFDVFASEFGSCGPTATYVLSDDGTLTISGAGYINAGAFGNNTSIKKVVIEHGVEKINADAFYYCTNITEITIPNSVKRIDACAFMGCTSLKRVELPEGITKVDNMLFEGCSALEEVILPESLTEIGDDAFHDCSSLKSLRIPVGVTKIGDSALERCHKLESLTFPHNLTQVGIRNFFCNNLENAFVTDASVADAFPENGNLWEYEVLDDQSGAPDGKILVRITHKNTGNSKELYTNSMSDPYIIKSVEVDDVTLKKADPNITIEESYTDALTPATVTATLAKDATGKLTFVVSGKPYTANIVNGKASVTLDVLPVDNYDIFVNYGGDYIYEYSNTVLFDGLKVTKAEIPFFTVESVFHIGGDRFAYLKHPDNATGTIVLRYDGSEVSLPAGGNGDEETTVFQTALIGDRTPGIYAVRAVLTDTTYNNATTGGVFAYCGRCGDDVYYYFTDDGKTLIIFGNGDMYDYNDNSPFDGNTSIEKVIIEDGVTSVGDFLFDECAGIKSVILPDSIREIGRFAFYYCESLETVNLPEGLTKIGECAFQLCQKLKDPILPSTLEDIDMSAFNGCSAITSITIPKAMNVINVGMFNNCFSLKTVYLPKSVYSIHDSAFGGCYQISDIYYEGNPGEKNSITIGSENDFITADQKWHYYSTIPDATYGTNDNPILISNYDELKAFANRVNGGETDLCARVTKDIEATDKTWVPIGKDEGCYYSGTFDGGFHTISGLSNEDVTEAHEYNGLFGYITGNGTVRNVIVGDIFYRNDLDSYAGGIAGRNGGTVENCIKLGGLTPADGYFIACGGIVGYNTGTIKNCINSGNYSINAEISGVKLGGIVYANFNGKTINCRNTGSMSAVNTYVYGQAFVGGIAQSNSQGGEISYCYSTGSVEAEGKREEFAGALVGYNYNSTYGKVSNSYFNSDNTSCDALGEGTTESNVAGLKTAECRVLSNFNDFEGNGWVIYNGEPVQRVFIRELVLDANDGSGDAVVLAAELLENKTVRSDMFERDGYEFTGWNTKRDGSGKSYGINDTIEITGSTVLYAQWKSTKKYTVTFVNGDTTLQKSDWTEGTNPTYSGTVPTKDSTAQYDYTFRCWESSDGMQYFENDTLPAVTGEETYTAVFDSTLRKYTIEFKNYDKTVLQSEELEYGETPEYKGNTPKKPNTDKYSYTFSGWSPKIASVTGEKTYTAQFTETINKYEISFVNWDGTPLQVSDWEYDSVPVYSGEEPKRPTTDEFTFTFNGWDSEISAVTGKKTYKAQYSFNTNEYAITFVNEDGTPLQKTNVKYGETPVYSGATPTKDSDAKYTYTFSDWDSEIETVKGPKTYTATYTKELRQYLIKFVNTDGTVLQQGYVDYDAVPVYSGEVPAQEADKQYTYTFNGWDSDISAVTGEATYTATYTGTLNKYKIDFVNEDGTVLQSGEVEYGTLPVYEGDVPEKEKTEEFTFTFDGWDSEIVAVTDIATYTATYSKTVNEYDITFVDGDGNVLQTVTVKYGETPEYTGDTPTKATDGEHCFRFIGWDENLDAVTGEKTYTAKFEELDIPEYIVQGESSVKWTKGCKDALVITIKRSYDDSECFSHYGSTLIDGKEAKVDAKAGSTVITIDADTLEALDVGNHTVTVNFDDGKVEVQLEIAAAEPAATPAEQIDIPKTGKVLAVTLVVWIVALIFIGYMCVDIYLNKKRGAKR